MRIRAHRSRGRRSFYFSVAESCFCWRVFGTVQGVYFRHSTRIEAERLGLRGHARNLPDGSVEVLASGAVRDLETLRAWLSHGPPQARVERIEDAGVAGDGSNALTDEFRVL